MVEDPRLTELVHRTMEAMDNGQRVRVVLFDGTVVEGPCTATLAAPTRYLDLQPGYLAMRFIDRRDRLGILDGTQVGRTRSEPDLGASIRSA